MIVIKKILWSGGACPYQIEAITSDDKFFYLRYRGGVLRFGVWENESKFDIGSYMFTKRVGGQYEGWADDETFNRELKDLVQFPEGFVHTDGYDADYPPEGGFRNIEIDADTKKMLEELLGGDSSGPRNPIIPNV